MVSLKYLMLAVLVIIAQVSYCQDDIINLNNYKNEYKKAIGVKIGDITGVQFQLFRGGVCPKEKDQIRKKHGFELTIGESRLPNQVKNFYQSNDKIASKGIRVQLNYNKCVYRVLRGDIYIGTGLQVGQRNVLKPNNSVENQFSSGINILSGVEYFLFKTNNHQNPTYFSCYSELSFYNELRSRYFNSLYLGIGIRANFWH
jgi:hypothetical protein